MKVFRSSFKSFFIGHYKFYLLFSFAFVSFDTITSSQGLYFFTVAFFSMLFSGAILVAALLTLSIVFFPIKLSSELICGYKASGIKVKCHWSDIIEVKLKSRVFIHYLYLYDGNGKNLIIIPYKDMAKQDEFDAAIREFTSPDHPLRAFI